MGIGGLLDTTNVVTGEIAVITSIGLDHQETLGDSLEEIAEQKAGIFKSGKKAVIAKLAPEAEFVCQKRAKELDVDLYQAGQDFALKTGNFSSSLASFSQLEIGLEGAYQQENAALALQTFLLFMASREERVEEELTRQALKETHWAGRIGTDSSANLPRWSSQSSSLNPSGRVLFRKKIQQGFQVQILFWRP